MLLFSDLRRPDEVWLGWFLQDALRGALLRTGKAAVMEADTAYQWQAQLKLEDLSAPAPELLRRMRLTVLVQGTVQQVLDSVEVRMRVSAIQGDGLSPAVQSFKFHFQRDTPAAVVTRLAGALLPAAAGTPAGNGGGDASVDYPLDWPTLRSAYLLLSSAQSAATPSARAELQGGLRAIAGQKGVAGPVNAALAELTLQDALAADPQARPPLLQQALQAARRASAAEPWNADRLALLGEVHYFLRQDFEAKTDASVARLKNPLNALAYAVLGLTAGPSTGEGTGYLLQARQTSPFLWGTARVPGTAPYQGGILEPALSRWDAEHRALLGRKRRGDELMSETLRQGIAQFDARQYDRAASTLARAAQEDEYDYRPLLYQLRILVETGRGNQALAPMRGLAADYPDEPEIPLQLGIALLRSGQPEEARQILLKVVQDDPRNPQALLQLALALGAAGQWEEALAPLTTLAAAQPGNAQAWLQLGITHFNLEHWQEADAAFEKAQLRDPRLKAATEWRARIKAKLAKPEPPPTRP